MSSPGVRPIVFVVLAAVCFGTTGTAQAYGPDAASSSAVGLTRIVVGGALLGLVAWWVAGRPRRRSAALSRSQLLVVVTGGAAVLAYQPAFFAGARLNGVAVAAAVMLGAAPVLTGLLEWVVTRQVPAGMWFIATACAICGVVLLSGLLESSDTISMAGLAGSLGAGAAYAVYAVATKRLLSDGWSPTAAIGSIFATAAVLGAPFLLLVDLSWLGEPSGLSMVVWLAVVTVAIAYTLFAIGLQELSAATASTLTLAEPMTACVLGIVLLDERLSPTGWLGLAILSAGIVALAVGAASRQRDTVRS